MPAPMPGRTDRVPGGVTRRSATSATATPAARALPDAVQVSDRWHLWRNLCDRVLLEVRAHAGCWATINPPRPGRSARADHPRTLEQGPRSPRPGRRSARLLPPPEPGPEHRQTLRPHARTADPRIAPAYRPTLVDPYRDHLRARRAADPAIPVTQLLREIRELGYTVSANLLVRYLNQGRAEGDHRVTTPRHARRLLLTDPENLRPRGATLLEKIAGTCPEMTALADLVRGFAVLLKPAEGNDVKLTEWITTARAVDLPHVGGGPYPGRGVRGRPSPASCQRGALPER